MFTTWNKMEYFVDETTTHIYIHIYYTYTIYSRIYTIFSTYIHLFIRLIAMVYSVQWQIYIIHTDILYRSRYTHLSWPANGIVEVKRDV